MTCTIHNHTNKGSFPYDYTIFCLFCCWSLLLKLWLVLRNSSTARKSIDPFPPCDGGKELALRFKGHVNCLQQISRIFRGLIKNKRLDKPWKGPSWNSLKQNFNLGLVSQCLHVLFNFFLSFLHVKIFLNTLFHFSERGLQCGPVFDQFYDMVAESGLDHTAHFPGFQFADSFVESRIENSSIYEVYVAALFRASSVLGIFFGQLREIGPILNFLQDILDFCYLRCMVYLGIGTVFTFSPKCLW